MNHATKILAARDARESKRRALLKKWPVLLQMTTVIPGPEKNTQLSRIVEKVFVELMKHWLGAPMIVEPSYAGTAYFFKTTWEAEALKHLTKQLEDTHPLGRLIDLDVYTVDGPVNRTLKEARICLICDDVAHVCSRAMRHSLEALQLESTKLVQNFFIESLAAAAVEALRKEVYFTPKLALVGPKPSWVHPDMTLDLFLASAESLRPYFKTCVQEGLYSNMPNPDRLVEAGKQAEETMFATTKQVNTHKGAIFIMGVVLPFLAHALWFEKPLLTVRENIATYGQHRLKQDWFQKNKHLKSTAGWRAYENHGITGIRGEVAAGLPSLFSAFPKPTWSTQRKFVSILAHLDDTTVIKRHGINVLRALQADMKVLLNTAPFSETTYSKLSEQYCIQGVSPGGAADMLACLFLFEAVEYFFFGQ